MISSLLSGGNFLPTIWGVILGNSGDLRLHRQEMAAHCVSSVIRNDGVTGSNPVCGTSKSLKMLDDLCAICANQNDRKERNHRVTTQAYFAGTGPQIRA
jgi:hypothetical protein